MSPSLGNGKICYLEIPTTNAGRSAAFYRDALGWTPRTRSDGAIAFDDGVGEVSGTWVSGRPPNRDAGTLVYVMVDDISETMRRVEEHGGEIVLRPPSSGETIAHFRDPDGNLFGLYQEPAR